MPHFVGENPLPFYLARCKYCNFIGYPEDYAPENSDKNEISQSQIKKILNLPLTKKIPEQAQMFFIAGKIYEELKKNPYFTANLYLRGAWCCRLIDNRKAEVELQQ